MEPRQGKMGHMFRVRPLGCFSVRPLLIEMDKDGYRLREYDQFDHTEQLSM